jgi:SP family sugar:H+ symporter-like MFS transporter
LAQVQPSSYLLLLRESNHCHKSATTSAANDSLTTSVSPPQVFVLGAFLYGYDGTYFTGMLEMQRFKEDFGEYDAATGTYEIKSTYTAVFASIVQAGEFVGSLMASVLGDYLGRKGALWTAVLIVTIGCILQLILVGSISLLIVGRLILGIGVGIVSNCVPMYLSEIPPAAIRGSIVSTWQLTLAIGQVSVLGAQALAIRIAH